MTPRTATSPKHPARRRLSGSPEKRGTRTGMPVWGALLFGLPFVGTGAFVILAGLHIVPVDPSSIHAPYPIVVLCGAVFAMGGLMVWGMAATQLEDEMRRRVAKRRYGGSEAMVDHGWDVRGFTPPRWGRAMQHLIGACLFGLFFALANFFAWFVPVPWWVKGVAVFFNLVLLLVWWQAGLVIARAIRFGGSRVNFDHFPYRAGEQIALGWVAPRGLAHAEKGSFTLRCVEEYYEERGSGEDKNKWLVHDELCAEVQSFDAPQSFVPGRALELRFSPPADAPPTKLDSERPVFWELEVKLSRPGLDFNECYLIPIYAR